MYFSSIIVVLNSFFPFERSAEPPHTPNIHSRGMRVFVSVYGLYSLSTHWSWDKITIVSQPHFQMRFIEWKYMIKQQAIIQSNDDWLLTHICVIRPQLVDAHTCEGYFTDIWAPMWLAQCTPEQCRSTNHINQIITMMWPQQCKAKQNCVYL